MTVSYDRASCIFGNEMSERTYAKACKAKAGYIKRFGDDADAAYHLKATELPVVGQRLGIRDLTLSGDDKPLDLYADAAATAPAGESEGAGRPIVVGNIRMGFGHYRIALAMASAAHALGYAPYWLDLCALQPSTCSKTVMYQNDLYSKGSRMSQKSRLFNRLIWEPMNYEGFRKISYNASDQKVSELYAAPLRDLPLDVPFIGTHVWPSQAAVHARLMHVVNAIPDNWPMALHLAEGSIHTVQTPGAWLGYKELRGMDKSRALKPMPRGSVYYTGHYVDHELVSNIEADCAAREARLSQGKPVRYLLSVGGAGAQQQLFRDIVRHLLPYVEAGQAALLINVGDHANVWEGLKSAVPELTSQTIEHIGDFDEVARFADAALTGPLEGIHAFCDSDIFAAVYSTNLLMRCCDVLVTKPSELSFYPVPKMMIHRVGGHERWGAIRAAEVGDGTYELETMREIGAMIDVFQSEREIIGTMCDNIRVVKTAGIYDGAYKVVRLAAGQDIG